MDTLISVVIPLYNHSRYIVDTIESVRRQSYSRYEIIIVDDGSSDGGDAVCERLLAGMHNARLLRQENQGAHHAINNGVRYAKGDYIAVLNSDDQFLEGKLVRCNELIHAKNAPDLIFGGVSIIDDNGRDVLVGETVDWLGRAHQFLHKVGNLPLAIANENFAVTTSNMVFSRGVWEKIGGFQNLRYCHDMDFLLSAARLGRCEYDEKIRHIKYRVHQKNTIKENLGRIRLEIAGVLAVAIADGGLALFGGPLNDERTQFVRELLSNKGISDLLVALMGMYGSYVGREDFYRALSREEIKGSLIKAFLS